MDVLDRGNLVLTRKPGQSIVVDQPQGLPPIEVSVVDVRGDKVRLAVRAHSSRRVLRKELIEQAA